MGKKKIASEIEQASFEEALQRLETIVRRLEQGGETLDDALQDYSDAIALLKACHKRLELAERKIEVLSGVDAEGKPIMKQMMEIEGSLEEKRGARSQRRTAGLAEGQGDGKSSDLGLF